MVSIGIINTLFSLIPQETKEILEAAQSWNTRNLTESCQHIRYCSFQPVIPTKFKPPGILNTYRYFCSLQFGELTESI